MRSHFHKDVMMLGHSGIYRVIAEGQRAAFYTHWGRGLRLFRIPAITVRGCSKRKRVCR